MLKWFQALCNQQTGLTGLLKMGSSMNTPQGVISAVTIKTLSGCFTYTL